MSEHIIGFFLCYCVNCIIILINYTAINPKCFFSLTLVTKSDVMAAFVFLPAVPLTPVNVSLQPEYSADSLLIEISLQWNEVVMQYLSHWCHVLMHPFLDFKG